MSAEDCNNRRSTNPFESDDSSRESSGWESINHNDKRRSAPLDFTLKSYDRPAAPALNFDQVEGNKIQDFVSPLEQALNQMGNDKNGGISADTKWPTTDVESDVSNENSALLVNYDSQKTESKYHSTGISNKYDTSRVMKHPQPTRSDNECAVDNKVIRLEDLGTASSWTVLLLPYLAFLVCVLLESWSGLKIISIGPLSATSPCLNSSDILYSDFPLHEAPVLPCSYDFKVDVGQTIFLKGYKSSSSEQQPLQRPAIASTFESGIISNVPSSSTFLYADAVFRGLSTETVALVAQGSVICYSILLQRRGDNVNEKDWIIVAMPKPERLSMACRLEDQHSIVTPNSTWICNSPRIIDALFSMPGTAILTADDLRLNVVFSYSKLSQNKTRGDLMFVYVEEKEHLDLFASTKLDSAGIYVDEIMKSSSYVIEYTNPLLANLDLAVRIIALSMTFIFTVFWLCKVGGSVGRRDSMYVSEWVIFPERWYILLLLLSLILIQGPLPVILYFNPKLNARPHMHAGADSMVGIGVNGVLFVYLCLIEGFKYHTATIARKLLDHQRKAVELRRAAKYIIGPRTSEADMEHSISKYIDDYFERHGDVDGSTIAGHLRLRHDPFGGNWTDFLLPKIFILMIGVFSTTAIAYTRFPEADSVVTSIDPGKLAFFNTIYVLSSFVQFFIVMLWMILILRNVIVTGRKLRLEPFLSTRPAQLAYRILFAHLTLGFAALAVPIIADILRLFDKWTSGTGGSASNDIGRPRDLSTLDLMLRALAHVAQRFPYSGTAASIGFGRIFFATVSILITAFIFLPPINFNDKERSDAVHRSVDHVRIFDNPNRIERLRQRRDKRQIVTLARLTHTWRVFPLPIKRTTGRSRIIALNNGNGCAMASVGNYVPVFCVELACWLNEASFQAYYSPTSKSWDDLSPGKMNLESIGLKLEAAILDESTSTQAFVATNLSQQVDGEFDSIIVVAFRGSVDACNIRTDLKSRQVPLLDQIMGIDTACFKICRDGVAFYGDEDWIWDTPSTQDAKLRIFSNLGTATAQGCVPSSFCASHPSSVAAVKSGAKALLGATPVARGAIPCVHEGFLEVYTHIRRKVIESILPVVRRQLAKAAATKNRIDNPAASEVLPIPKIYVTGHSLGGSLAQLLALDLSSNCELILEANSRSTAYLSADDDIFRPSFKRGLNGEEMTSCKSDESSKSEPKKLSLRPAICVYTFGQPRLGNRAFSRFYKQRVPHTFRVANEGDPITSMPNVVFCSGFYKHAGLEVVLDEGKNGNILVGPTVVETLFRFHKVRTNLASHSIDQYRDGLESALAEHELEEYYKGHSTDPEAAFGFIRNQANNQVPEWMTHFSSKK